MQHQLISAAILLVVVAATAATDLEKMSTRDYDFNVTCMERLNGHLKIELEASITYLTMGAWANHYAVQRPGLAKFFFASASEERQHALSMLDYLRMRGYNVLTILPEKLEPLNQKYKWDSPLEALKQALDMEKDVTRRIKSIIDYCSAAEDHHLADWLTADFMDEQLRGQRALAGHYNTLHGLIKKQPALANWIFDNKLNA